MPMTAMRSESTSSRAVMASATGVSTASQSGRNGMPLSNQVDCWPGPSNVIQW